MSNASEYSEQMEWNILCEKDGNIADIQLENTSFKNDLSNKRLTVDFAYFENENLPMFIPEKLSSFPVITPTPTTIYNNTIDINSIDYSIRMKNVTTGDTYVSYLKWSPELPEPAPAGILSQPEEYFLNKYYWGKSTVHFAQILTNTIHDLAVAIGVLTPLQAVQVVVGSTAFGLVINQAFTTANIQLEFSHSLDKLFLLQTVYTDSLYRRIIFGNNTVSYASQTCVTSQGLAWSNKWFPYQQVLITSDLKLKKIQRQTNAIQKSSSFYNTNYKNVVLIFNILEPNPNQIYPYFEYITESSNTKYVYFDNDVDFNQTYGVKVYLHNIKKNILIPYTMNLDELINIKLRHFTKQ